MKSATNFANAKTRSGAALAWLEMGQALTIIRDKRLHHATHSNLENYCWEKFHLDRSTIYRLISAARRFEVVAPIAAKHRMQFGAESQMRPLCQCQAVDLPNVLKLVAMRTEPDADGNRAPTAKIVAEAVHEVKSQASSIEAATNGAKRRKNCPDAAALAVRTMKDWADSTLLSVARTWRASCKPAG